MAKHLQVSVSAGDDKWANVFHDAASSTSRRKKQEQGSNENSWNKAKRKPLHFMTDYQKESDRNRVTAGSRGR